MIKRFSYYLTRLQQKQEAEGLIPSGIEIFNFLISRQFFISFFRESLDYHLISKFRTPESTVIQTFQVSARPAVSKKWAIYASFDIHGSLKGSVLQQLEALRENDFNIVFVTCSKNLTNEDKEKIKKYCQLVIHRRNQGYDFGSWKVGYLLSKDQMRNAESVLLMNDSCYGPYFDLGKVFERCERIKAGLFGITKSYEIDEYLQSYFLFFGKDLIRSGAFDAFMARIRLLKTKNAVVRFFEIGGSQFLKQKGFTLEALVDPKSEPVKSELKKHRQTDPVVNPVGRWLVEQGLTPFYKRSNGSATEIGTTQK